MMPKPKLVSAPKNKIASTVGVYPGMGMSPLNLATSTMMVPITARASAVNPE